MGVLRVAVPWSCPQALFMWMPPSPFLWLKAKAKPLYVVPKSIATTAMYDELAENNKPSDAAEQG